MKPRLILLPLLVITNFQGISQNQKKCLKFEIELRDEASNLFQDYRFIQCDVEVKNPIVYIPINGKLSIAIDEKNQFCKFIFEFTHNTYKKKFYTPIECRSPVLLSELCGKKVIIVEERPVAILPHTSIGDLLAGNNLDSYFNALLKKPFVANLIKGNKTYLDTLEKNDKIFKYTPLQYNAVAITKINELIEYIKILENANSPEVEINKVIDLVCGLFLKNGDSTRIDVLPSSGTRRTYLLRSYLKRLSLIKVKVKINSINIDFIKDIRLGADGNYYGFAYEQNYLKKSKSDTHENAFYTESKLNYYDIETKGKLVLINKNYIKSNLSNKDLYVYLSNFEISELK